MTQTINPALDLVLERTIDVSPELVWKAWTTPEQMKQWFTPEPWKTVEVELDLRPGGRFYSVMQSPEGENFPNEGCFLEIVENRKLVWTSALGAGYRPLALPNTPGCESLAFTAILTMEPHGSGTKYTATVIHGDEASKKRHEEMGFHEGWGKVLDQLVEMIKRGS